LHGESSTRSIDSKDVVVPSDLYLLQNYPNPFNYPATVIEYTLCRPEFVHLHIYNQLGQCIRTLVNELQQQGWHRVAWDSRAEGAKDRMSSGIYVYELKAGQAVVRKKMVLLH
jgi:hypothetical protein